MRFTGGFRIRRRVTTLFHRFKFGPRRGCLINWFQRARFAIRRVMGMTRFRSGYVRIKQESNPQPTVPKGYLAVYVGRWSTEVNGEYKRVLVPVIQFNHPLFVELLKEAEDEFGFEHSGGIKIPCRISEFEDVRMRINAGRGGDNEIGGGRRRRVMTWRKMRRW